MDYDSYRKGVAAMAANQYEYEDDYEEVDNGPAELRKALKKAQKEREALEAELNKMRIEVRSRTVKDVLTSKGVSPKLAKLIPGDITAPEEIDAWLSEYSDVFGIQNQSAEPVVSEADIQSAKKIDSATSTASSAGGPEDLYAKLMNAKNIEELNQITGNLNTR